MKSKILQLFLIQALLAKSVLIFSQSIIGYSELFVLGIEQNISPTVIGYSELLSMEKKHNENTSLIDYSSLFTLGRFNYEHPNLIDYSGIFQMNTRTSLVITGYSNLFTLDTKELFSAWPLAVETQQTVKFASLTETRAQPMQYVWNFGDFSSGNNRFQANPEHKYAKSGNYAVSLTITNSAGIPYSSTKINYISVEKSGIKLEIMKTAPGSGPEIAKVGYYYTTKTNNNQNPVSVRFDVVNGKAMIDDFPGLGILPAGTTLTSSFNNELFLYDQNMKVIGHIYYEYQPEKERKHKRNAILILHNDSEICADNAFPYSTNSPDYDPEWKYYRTDEYPVSMLIPPNNTFQTNYSKTPLLLIHGWEGAYELKKNPNAMADANETSYWFTTVKQLNVSSMPFDAWQYYYPYNDAHKHLAICLKSALGKLKSYYPSKKIGLVTHSMGGLVTLRYLIQFPDDAVDKVEKVLFLAPPSHGSLGANLYYNTKYSAKLQEVLKMDPYAPAVRDLKLGSDATWFIYNNSLPDLNNQNGVSDDYFVILGTTFNWYLSDKKFIAYDKIWMNSHLVGHSSIHSEASKHHDGIVAVSSGSLLNKGVGFATFHGNHNDAVHMQSCQRGNKSRQNIGEASLLPNIIKSYFTGSQSGFLNYLQGNDAITAVVKHNRIVLKPSGQYTLNNLNTGNKVEYNKGVLNLKFDAPSQIKEFNAYYRESKPTLILTPAGISNLVFPEDGRIGVFRRVEDKTLVTNKYYFNVKFLFGKEEDTNRSISYNGCALSLFQGKTDIIVLDKFSQTLGLSSFYFRFCESTHITINLSNLKSKIAENNFTDSKHRVLLSAGVIVPDSVFMPFYIDNQATEVRFSLSSFDAVIDSLNVCMKLRLPDGTLADSTFEGSTYSHNYALGVIEMQIPEPMPGLWHVWLEAEEVMNDEAIYSGMAFIESDVYAYLPDSSVVAALETSVNLSAALQANELNLVSLLKVMATIYDPDGVKETLDITASGTVQDSSYIFSHDYIFNNQGQYFIKYNIDGVYNNFNFERCLHQYIEAVDTIPVFSLPDITLRQNENFKEVNLLSSIYNISAYDTIYFSSEIIESNVDTTTFSALMDSTATTAWFFSSLADTGLVMMRFVCYYDNNSIADTMYVNILVPELAIAEAAISDTVVSNGGEIIVDYTIANTGNSHTGSYEVKYYITQDSALQVSDFALGSFQVVYHEPDSIINVSDTLALPQMALAGNYFLMIQADATEVVSEIDETNNQVLIAVTVNPPPDAPFIIAAIPGNKEVQLSYTAGGQGGITGFAIYYGQDTTEILQKILPYSADTTYTVSDLMKDSTYYFAVSCYRTVNNESQLSGFVSAIPIEITEVLHLSDVTFSSEADNCFAATQSIIASDFLVESAAVVVLVAGESIKLESLVQIMIGSHFRAFIDSTGNYCQQPESIISLPEQDVLLEPVYAEKNPDYPLFRVYPNPTTGVIKLLIAETERLSNIHVTVFGMMGEQILSAELYGRNYHEIDLSAYPRGVYLIRVVYGDKTFSAKIIRQ